MPETGVDASEHVSRRSSALRAVGVGQIEESVYRARLEAPVLEASVVELATGFSEEQVEGALTRLESMGFVSRLPTAPVRFVPASPQVAIEALAVRRLAEVTEAR